MVGRMQVEVIHARFTVGEPGRKQVLTEVAERIKNRLWDEVEFEGLQSRHCLEGRLE